ncbi:MAG: flagellar basal-body rod protein FlgG [Pseudomonadota bacterium]
MKSLSIAATGMQAQELNVEVISNDLANVNTTAYKRRRAEFQDLLYQTQQRMGASSSSVDTIIPAGIQIGLGVNTGAIYRITEQGELTQTSNTYDLAIGGKGYFVVDLPDGDIAYTRAGTFSLNADGLIVTQDGFTVSPGITVPLETTNVSINEEGEVIVTLNNEATTQNVGQFDLAIFVNEAGLDSIGNNLLTETEASGVPILGTANVDDYGNLLQGFLESSNVDPITALTDLIAAQRGYELNSQVIQTADEMMQTANQAKS